MVSWLYFSAILLVSPQTGLHIESTEDVDEDKITRPSLIDGNASFNMVCFNSKPIDDGNITCLPLKDTSYIGAPLSFSQKLTSTLPWLTLIFTWAETALQKNKVTPKSSIRRIDIADRLDGKSKHLMCTKYTPKWFYRKNF